MKKNNYANMIVLIYELVFNHITLNLFYSIVVHEDIREIMKKQ